ncbi:hypothetical protein NEUTE1DRAFT_102780 [Neurospora tetrasperma FGSC 2508]|uniref:Uncharacterized protein n=1 Tax=Neurospora tetrasperma (strain FGSC 2508 / ATCC MYA-4615 / P0657) TaxID=510951 RepID=F8MTL3_NEUT8|nr:uncharacterized protein NEUTE1DRAFT_102780 [Neurospora tetrasperma FGSC 2508]EGO55345.1 hypothetical protein NEUTE1DRAFT_102780 [Neurospora tetrasperma FGSC 2508]
MSAQSPKRSRQPMQPNQAPASQTHADQGPAKRKAMEQPQDDRRPARPGTLPFMWNLPTTPSLPIFNADSTPVMSDDEYEHELELENDEMIDELQEVEEQLHEAKKKIAALEKRLRTYQVIVLPMDYKTVTETAEESRNEKSTAEREAEALRAMYEEDNHKNDDEDKIEVFRTVFKDIEWAVEEHHRLVDQALEEIESGRTGPAGRSAGYKPGQLHLYILDKSQFTLGVDVSGLKDLFEEIVEEFQNLRVELDQTKEKLREAENRIAELAIDNQTIQEDLKNVRELLGVARDDKISAKIQLRVYEDSVRCLEATLRGMDSALRKMGTALNGSIPRSKIANYRSILDKIHQCHMENTLAVSSILTYDRERRNNPRINEQVNKLNEATCDITSHFNALYDALESNLAESSISNI